MIATACVNQSKAAVPSRALLVAAEPKWLVPYRQTNYQVLNSLDLQCICHRSWGGS